MQNAKRILYIGTPIFNYHLQIIREFEAYGFEVDYYNDRPSESSFVKGLIKINKNLVKSLINNYFQKIVTETMANHYDLIFIVNGKVYTEEMLKCLKEFNPTSKFVLYMWDSLDLYPHVKKILPLFDKCYSFDSHDCEKYNELELLPLFYSKAYGAIGGLQERNHLTYDLASICTAHPVRYKTIQKLFPLLKAKGIRIYSFMFLNSLQFLYNKVFVEDFKAAKKEEFSFKPLSESEVLKILEKSDTVFDIQHNMQSGLTMRTIETLGARRKLITTNQNVVNYDFYNENNIYILTETNWSGIYNFIRNSYIDIDIDIYNNYSISAWATKIINSN